MPADLLAIDPGIRSPGAALFRDGRLIAATRIRFKIDTTQNAATRCKVAADAVLAWALASGLHWEGMSMAFEWPQIYARDTPARANAVVTMAGVDMALATMLNCRALNCYLPAEVWGQLPKSTTGKASGSPRALRIASRLDAAELALMPDQHDAIDAIGIGLHALGRLGVRRALSSGG